jgi:hypothetical protein
VFPPEESDNDRQIERVRDDPRYRRLLDRLDGSVLCVGPDRNEAAIPDGIAPRRRSGPGRHGQGIA